MSGLVVNLTAERQAYAERKAFETTRARAALAGIELRKFTDASFLLSRAGRHFVVDDLWTVSNVLDQLEGPRHA